MGRAFEYRKAAKLKRWGTMSRIFPKLGKVITMAAKDGGSDPDMNSKLRTAIINAKAQNMPKDNIEAAIKRASSKDLEDIKELSYEAKAPFSVQLFIDCATDNSTRTIANVRAILSKNGAETLKNGSLDFMFTRKSVFVFDKKDSIDLEELELELIDFGLQSIEEDIVPQDTSEDKKVIKIYGELSSFGELAQELERRGIQTTLAELQRVANSPIDLTTEQLETIDTLIDKLENDEDVQAVYTNIN
jgi:YebC/PmpR family DNA-binding regulatory protein